MTERHIITERTNETGNVPIYEATCSCGWTWATATRRGLTTSKRAHLRRAVREAHPTPITADEHGNHVPDAS